MSRKIIRIDAGPGCGKSHTLANIFMFLRANNRKSWYNNATPEQLAIYEWCDKNLPPSCRTKCGYFAYNDDIVQDMKKKMHPETECKTAHGWGYSIINRECGFVPINGARSVNIAQTVAGQALAQMDNKEKFRWLSAIRHFEKLKEELLDPTDENCNLVHAKYDGLAPFQTFEGIGDLIKKMMPLHKTPNRKLGIEYIDQVWLALFLIKTPVLPLGLIDEDQDLSPARLRLALQLFDNIIFCGDENQSINAYSGADPESVNKIRDYVEVEFPLKESFRCPPNICNNLNALIPTAKVRPSKARHYNDPEDTTKFTLVDKKPGIESRMSLDELVPHLKLLKDSSNTTPEQDAVVKQYGINKGNDEWNNVLLLCRYNAPLVKVCIKLIESEIPCYILGETLIKSLCDIVDNRKARSLPELSDKLDTWCDHCSRAAPDIIKMQLKDKVDCIKAVLPYCNDVSDVNKELKRFMKPPKADGLLKLSTIHRAKGLEAKHVFILFPPIEYPKCKTEVERTQERNLHFVAVSRTKRNLTWVMED